MEIKLDVNQPEETEPNEKKENPLASNHKFLASMPLHVIARNFSSFGAENRVTVIPIGFPQAGKSMLLSSLFRYAVKGKDTLFNTNFENKFPFDNGRKAADTMVEYFENGKIYFSTAKGTLDLVGLSMNPTNPKLPTLQLAYLDLAGEDIENIKTSNRGDFTAKINAVFNGLEVDDSPVIFVLITPFDPPRLETLTSDAAHQREDTLHFDFLNYLKQDQPKLFSNSKFFIVVSQWDKNNNPKVSVEDFIKKHRPAIYNSVKNSEVTWGEYSIGKLLTTTDEEGKVFQELVKIDHDCPARFWKKLYSVCTNKGLDKKTFWEKLFS